MIKKIMKVLWSSQFLKAFKRFCKKNPDFKANFQIFFQEFCNNPLDSRFRLHKLKEKLKDLYSAKIEYDLRLILEIEDGVVMLIDIGTHDQVY